MQFQAHYIAQRPQETKQKEYWRTVHADTLNDADTEAKKMRRTGYMLGLVIESKFVNNN